VGNYSLAGSALVFTTETTGTASLSVSPTSARCSEKRRATEKPPATRSSSRAAATARARCEDPDDDGPRDADSEDEVTPASVFGGPYSVSCVINAQPSVCLRLWDRCVSTARFATM